MAWSCRRKPRVRELEDVRKRAELTQTSALKKACQALGTHQAEAELARRDMEWADAQAALTLLAYLGRRLPMRRAIVSWSRPWYVVWPFGK